MHRKKILHMQRRITDKRPLLQTDVKRVARYQANVEAMNEPFSRHPKRYWNSWGVPRPKPNGQTAIVPLGFWGVQNIVAPYDFKRGVFGRPNFRPVEWDKAVA